MPEPQLPEAQPPYEMNALPHIFSAVALKLGQEINASILIGGLRLVLERLKVYMLREPCNCCVYCKFSTFVLSPFVTRKFAIGDVAVTVNAIIPSLVT